MAAQMDLFSAMGGGDQRSSFAMAPSSVEEVERDRRTPEITRASVASLRPYQEEAVTKTLVRLEEDRSTLIVMPTGSGKTRVSTEICLRRPKDRVLFLAHRDELLQQGRARLAKDTDEIIGLDQAGFYAGDERIVVGSIQTVSMQQRLERFDPKHFNLIIVDEAHHSPAPSYKRVLDYFADAKVVGVTATPDRADEKAMGQIFDSVAFLYEIEDAIRDGWLCDVVCTRINIAGLDMSGVRTTAGDLNAGELDAVMKVEGVLQGIADATIREAGDRKTLVFTTSVENAHRLAEILCRHRAGCAMAVDGKTDTMERRQILSSHQGGGYQFLVNVGIATEGYDDPSLSCVAIARPTKSRALYAQMAGRGLRIAQGKGNCLLLDFVGNSGRHKLASALDILGGKYTEEEEELAQQIVAKSPGTRARDAIDAAKAQIEREKQLAAEAARRASLKAKAIYTKQAIDPFSTFHMDVSEEREIADRFGGRPPTEKQLNALKRFKIPIPDGITSQLANKLIGTAIVRCNNHLATFKQISILQRFGVPDSLNMSFDTASRVIDSIVKNGWKAPSARQVAEATGNDF